MKARIVHTDGGQRVVAVDGAVLIETRVYTPPPDVDRTVWVELTPIEASELRIRLGQCLDMVQT